MKSKTYDLAESNMPVCPRLRADREAPIYIRASPIRALKTHTTTTSRCQKADGDVPDIGIRGYCNALLDPLLNYVSVSAPGRQRPSTGRCIFGRNVYIESCVPQPDLCLYLSIVNYRATVFRGAYLLSRDRPFWRGWLASQLAGPASWPAG